jgi:hypothetical protein
VELKLKHFHGNTEIPMSYMKLKGTAQSLDSMCSCDIETEFIIHETGLREIHCAVTQMTSFLYLYETWFHSYESFNLLQSKIHYQRKA